MVMNKLWKTGKGSAILILIQRIAPFLLNPDNVTTIP